MKICHVSPHLPPDQGANALLPAALGEWQRARGDDVRFVSHPGTQGRDGASPADVQWVPRRSKARGVARFLRLDVMQVVRPLNAALARTTAGVDLLHLHSNGLIIEAAARFANRQHLPYVLTLYGTEIWHYTRKWPVDAFRGAYFGAAHVTFYSRLLRDRARELGLGRSHLSVVYPAVSDEFSPADEGTRARLRAALGIREPLVILNVKRLHELAGQQYLIEAFADIARARDDVRLVICGTGPLLGDLDEHVKMAGIGGRVTFAGLVANDAIHQYYAMADVFALPSLLEAMPTVAVEALASGTPVVSADHPGGCELHELFGDDVALVPRRDPAALASALSAALTASRRTRPATADLVRRHFRPAAVMAAYDAVYDACIAGRVSR